MKGLLWPEVAWTCHVQLAASFQAPELRLSEAPNHGSMNTGLYLSSSIATAILVRLQTLENSISSLFQVFDPNDLMLAHLQLRLALHPHFPLSPCNPNVL